MSVLIRVISPGAPMRAMVLDFGMEGSERDELSQETKIIEEYGSFDSLIALSGSESARSPYHVPSSAHLIQFA
jgi:hypothetical protein